MTQREQELSEKLFSGLSWDKIKRDLGKELTHQVAAGAHELAAALFNGHAFVMYPRNGQEDQPAQQQGQDGQNLDQELPHLHQERGGQSR